MRTTRPTRTLLHSSRRPSTSLLVSALTPILARVRSSHCQQSQHGLLFAGGVLR